MQTLHQVRGEDFEDLDAETRAAIEGGEFVFGLDDMQISILPEGEMFFIRLMPGMSVSLAKSCQSYICADDQRLRQFKVTRPPTEG